MQRRHMRCSAANTPRTNLVIAAAGLGARNLQLLGELGRQAAGLASVRHGALQLGVGGRGEAGRRGLPPPPGR